MVENPLEKTPVMVKILSVLLILMGLFAGAGSMVLAGQGLLLAFPSDINLAGPMADFFINFPVSILAGMGLWQMRFYGYVAAQFVAGFYLYASVMIFVEMWQGGLPSGVEIWVPQSAAVLVALLLVFYLWPLRDRFS